MLMFNFCVFLFDIQSCDFFKYLILDKRSQNRYLIKHLSSFEETCKKWRICFQLSPLFGSLRKTQPLSCFFVAGGMIPPAAKLLTAGSTEQLEKKSGEHVSRAAGTGRFVIITDLDALT